MKIISKYKDYYDHVSYDYGIDPLIVYKRVEELSGDLDLTRNYIEFKNVQGSPPMYSFRAEIEKKWKEYTKYDRNQLNLIYCVDVNILSVCGVLYPVIIETHKDMSKHRILITKEVFSTLVIPDEEGTYWNRQCYKTSKNLIDMLGVFCYPMVKFHKDLASPVLMVVFQRINESSNNFDIWFDKNVPNLGEIGFGLFRSSHATYQDISQFISTYFNTCEPPIEIGNTDKIVKGGFDLKKSFRDMK